MPLINRPWPLDETIDCETCEGQINVTDPSEVTELTRKAAQILCPLCNRRTTISRPEPVAVTVPDEERTGEEVTQGTTEGDPDDGNDGNDGNEGNEGEGGESDDSGSNVTPTGEPGSEPAPPKRGGRKKAKAQDQGDGAGDEHDE